MGFESPAPFSVRSDLRNGIVRVAVRGELDQATSPSLEEQLRVLESDGIAGVIVDLRDLASMDSAGLRTLLGASGRATAGGHRFSIVGVSPRAMHLFAMTGTERFLEEPGGLRLLELFIQGTDRRPAPLAEGVDGG